MARHEDTAERDSDRAIVVVADLDQIESPCDRLTRIGFAMLVGAGR